MDGTTNSVKNVPMIMPETSVMPMLLRAPAPGPAANTSGKCPNTVAALVMRIGRSRVPAASMTASSFAMPVSRSWFANCTIRMPFATQLVRELHDQDAVLRDQPHERDEPDLAVDVERREAEEREQQRPRDRERRRAGEDDERIAEALELGGEHEEDEDRRQQEDREELAPLGAELP